MKINNSFGKMENACPSAFSEVHLRGSAKQGKWKTENGKCLNAGMVGKIGNIILMVLFSSVISFAQNSQITWSSFNSGFGVSSSENSVVTSSAGFSFSGETKNGNSDIISGFLADYNLIITDVKDKESLIPTVYKLNQNYPNPFNPSTIINYQIPEAGFVSLKVYDILGNEVKTLVNENKSIGSFDIKFDATDLASGIYIYQIRANNFVQSRKMMLLK